MKEIGNRVDNNKFTSLNDTRDIFYNQETAIKIHTETDANFLATWSFKLLRQKNNNNNSF